MVIPVTVSSSAVVLNDFFESLASYVFFKHFKSQEVLGLILSYLRLIINFVCSFLNYKKAEGTGNTSVSNDVTSADFFFLFFNFMCMRVFCLNGCMCTVFLPGALWL